MFRITDPVVIELSDELTNIELIPISDLHIGDPLCDISLVKKYIEYIKNTPNAYCVLNGDLINNAVKMSVSDVYNDIMSPDEQIDFVYKLFAPIQDKILFITSGNHERRTNKEVGVDVNKYLAIRWGIEDRYRLEGGVLVIKLGAIKNKLQTNDKTKFRKVRYDFYITHGAGGARAKNPAVDLMPIIDVDCYIHSHVHRLMLEMRAYHRMDTRNNKVSVVDKLCMTTAAYLNYGGYGQIAKYSPASTRQGVLILDGTKKKLSAAI